MRERLFTIRMNDEESARLNRVAERYGLNAAALIRMLIKREDDAPRTMAGSLAAALQAAIPPARRKPRKRR